MLLIWPILIPALAGALTGILRFKSRLVRSVFCEAATLATSAVLLYLVIAGQGRTLRVLALTENLTVTLRVDGPTRVFAGLVAVLWPLASLYAFEYMAHESRENTFFAYYLMSYGVTSGIALSGNLFTLYAFYELLTLSTIPLVLHKMDSPSIHACRAYMYYSIGGAALAFIGMIFVITYGVDLSTDFVYGGALSPDAATHADLLRAVFLLTFVGFGAKAAVFPMHHWLPTVSVAPTPVTALLHAVAVVKAGAFAIIRAIYYSFGPELLRGSWAQYAAIGLSLFTILLGSVMAVREGHLKRRLAYSTVSNLSYVVFGAALMTPAGLTGALTHMLFHGAMKITLFFCAGAVLVMTGREYVSQTRGLAKRMPFTFAVFTVAAAALVGVPPLMGFSSKWQLATAAAAETPLIAVLGVGTLIVSAILTGVYMFTVVIPAYFMPLDDSAPLEAARCDPGFCMKWPLAVLAVAIVALGAAGAPLVDFLRLVAAGAL